MVTPEQLEQEIVEAIRVLTEKASKGSYSAAPAALQLAEGLAWIKRPDQPHGGSTKVSNS